jgi:hypothetical protein
MKKKQWHEIENSCDSFKAFIVNYFEWYSLEETLNYCIQIRDDNPEHFAKLVTTIKDTTKTCPESILEAFTSIDRIPVHYAEGQKPNIEEVARLFVRIGLFLEENQNINSSQHRPNISKEISKFLQKLQTEFNGQIGI